MSRSSHTPLVSVPPGPLESSLPRCPSPPLLPVWMYVYFLSPWCRTSLPFDFLSVLVVRGGAVCLPMPPSWFSPQVNISNFQCTGYSVNPFQLKDWKVLLNYFYGTFLPSISPFSLEVPLFRVWNFLYLFFTFLSQICSGFFKLSF